MSRSQLELTPRSIRPFPQRSPSATSKRSIVTCLLLKPHLWIVYTILYVPGYSHRKKWGNTDQLAHFDRFYCFCFRRRCRLLTAQKAFSRIIPMNKDTSGCILAVFEGVFVLLSVRVLFRYARYHLIAFPGCILLPGNCTLWFNCGNVYFTSIASNFTEIGRLISLRLDSQLLFFLVPSHLGVAHSQTYIRPNFLGF